MVLVVDSEENMNKLLLILSNIFKKFKLRINSKKAKILLVRKD